ncbi:ArsB/NhaD family transporter [Agathobacter ruminis]|uniref:Citrate transporter n=1 Tax=Agathobacter ruminis TaxID=1712665 RepID=A0A2G3DZK3_9FIRM|nr:ArsB/NhaD family transporter [Agathobacter ruminis]MDC7301865.1 ArsB/NhaD family transporter [Agathobacter ruminis]PHU36467.1 citrate transporter [Agathobacter ruminis]
MLAAQITAIVIFVAMFLMIISEKIERHWVTLGGALMTMICVFGLAMRSKEALLEVLNIRSVFTKEFWYAAGEASESTSGINWATILFIAGMMVMVEGMARTGFFRWLCMCIAKAVRYKTIPIFITFMVMSFVLSMFIDSITVILFLAAVTVELAQLLKFNPIPMILSEIFCANLGGSATMCGDPPNIIIGTAFHYSFVDFLTNTGLIAILSLVVIIIYFYLIFRKELTANAQTAIDTSALPKPASAIVDKKGFAVSCVIFLCAVVLLVTHAMTGLTVAFIGVFIALVTLLTSGRHCAEVLRKVDYKTLLFFIGLFVVVGGLEETKILELIAKFIEVISNGNVYIMIAIIIWVSAIASAFIDNIPFAATMVPVIKTLSAAGSVPLTTLAWALAMGTDVGGSATPIGASANVVGTSVAAKSGYPVGWGRYCKACAPATILVLAISTIYIFVIYL